MPPLFRRLLPQALHGWRDWLREDEGEEEEEEEQQQRAKCL